MRAVDILAKATDLVGGARAEQHGNMRENFENIARLWNAWIAIRKEPTSELTAYDVAQMMSLLKKARTQSGAHNPDDFVDDAGYAACAGQVGPSA